MAAIRGRDTKPERIIRAALHRAGFRYRLNRRDIPGKPDLVFPKFRAVVMVHGCFWHGHGCPRFKQPGGANAEFWRRKIARNAERDAEVCRLLDDVGWRHFVVWECAINGPGRFLPDEIVTDIARWLQSDEFSGEISGEFANAGFTRGN